MKKIGVWLLGMFIVIGFTVPAYATLIDRGADSLGNHLIYDTDLNVTWYDYTRTSFPLPTSSDWLHQNQWANDLSVNLNGNIYNDWRLPSTVDDPSLAGFNTTSSEMGHLYYVELGNVAGSGPLDTGLFSNLQPSAYWFNELYTSFPTQPDLAWTFYFGTPPGLLGEVSGLQSFDTTTDPGIYAIAVRSGDVVGASVPEPGTLLLLGSGLAALIAGRKMLMR